MISKTGLLDDYGQRAVSRDPRALEATALRTRSFEAREIVAHLATRGRMAYGELIATLHDRQLDVAPDTRRFAPDTRRFDPGWTLILGRVMALQDLFPSDIPNALSLYVGVERDHGISSFTDRDQKLYFELFFQLGHYNAASQLLHRLSDLTSPVPEIFSLDLMNPFLTTPHHSLEPWLSALNLLHTDNGLEPIRLRDTGPTAFDRITSEATSATTDGPLVSVILPTNVSGPRLDTAVRSILAQSWRNLELIIVDDSGSTQLHEIAEKYSDTGRVRVIQRPENGGTYVARNTGMDAASGDFVTFQDSDDWSHPRRIEYQLRPLLDDSSLLATQSLAFRVKSNLVFQALGYHTTQVNVSSLLFRRQPIRDRMGYFDTSRKAADTEFQLRIQACFGQKPRRINLPLAYLRFDPSSLSRPDFRPGWRHEARSAYRDAYTHWHEEIRQGQVDAYVSRDLAARRFPAPDAFLNHPSPSSRRVSDYDVVFLSNWQAYGGPQRSMIEEIRALTSHGCRVAVAHMEAFRFMSASDRRLCTPIQDFINKGMVDRILLDQRVNVETVIIRYPPILQFAPQVKLRWNCARVLVVANQAPSEKDGSDRRYVPDECSSYIFNNFGVTPLWVPQGPSIREPLLQTLTSAPIASFEMPGVLDPDEWVVKRRRFRSHRPVVGRHSRDNAVKWPAERTPLLDAYSSDFDVRVMGGTQSARSILGSSAAPPNWISFSYDQLPVRTFLAHLDFFVYFHHPNWIEAFGRTVLEALATGCVTILPHHFRDTFGDAAVYCDVSDVRTAVSEFYSDWDHYRQQSERAVQAVATEFSHASYVNLIERLRTADI